MIPILYEATETAFTSNGIARLSDTISATVTEERNGRFDMEFQYPVNGIHFDDITEGRIIAVTHDEDGDIQPFVIYSSSKPIDGVVTFNAYHLSYRLGQYMTSWGYASTTTIQNILSALNSDATDSDTNGEPWVFSTDISGTTTGYGGEMVPCSIREALGGKSGSVLDRFGGEYEFDKWTVNLWSSRGANNGVTIRYGKNLADFKAEADYSSACTHILASYRGDWLTGGQVQNGEIHQKYDTGHRLLGNLVAWSLIDFTDKIENGNSKSQATIKSELGTLAAAYATKNKPWEPSVSIDVDFVQLWQTEEYKNYAPLLKCKLCDTVNVTFPFYGLSDLAIKIVSVEWDVLNERYKKMTLGGLATTLSQSINSSLSGSIQANADAISAVKTRTWVSDVTVNGTSVVTDGIAAIAPTLQSATVSSAYSGSCNYLKLGRMVIFDANIATTGALTNGTVLASGLPANHYTATMAYGFNNNSTTENVAVYMTSSGTLTVRGGFSAANRSIRVSGAYISAS